MIVTIFWVVFLPCTEFRTAFQEVTVIEPKILDVTKFKSYLMQNFIGIQVKYPIYGRLHLPLHCELPINHESFHRPYVSKLNIFLVIEELLEMQKEIQLTVASLR